MKTLTIVLLSWTLIYAPDATGPLHKTTIQYHFGHGFEMVRRPSENLLERRKLWDESNFTLTKPESGDRELFLPTEELLPTPVKDIRHIMEP